MEEFLDSHRDGGHHSHGYSKSCLGCFNGSLYVFSFTCSLGKKWTLEVRLIELSNEPFSIISYMVLQNVSKEKHLHFQILLESSNGIYE